MNNEKLRTQKLFAAAKHSAAFFPLLLLFILIGCENPWVIAGTDILFKNKNTITAFSFPGIPSKVYIDEAAKTISVTVPDGTYVNGLIPEITHTGASIDPESGLEQDFSAPVIYTVKAADGSTAQYTVIVGFAPAYSISLSPGGTSLSEPYVLPQAVEGYTTAPTLTVTVTNTGFYQTGDLEIMYGSGWYCSISSSERISLNSGGSATFVISPTTIYTNSPGTHPNTYSLRNSDGVIMASLYVSFTVVPAPAYGISLSETGVYTFPAVTVGYGPQTPLTVTVTNTGNQPTGALTLALGGSNDGAYTLSTTSISSIAVGGNAQFTVTPNTGQIAGVYTGTILTVSGANGLSESFEIHWTINAVPTYTVSINTATGGSISADKTTGIIAGETVTLTITENTGYVFNSITSTPTVAFGGTGLTRTFTMPSENVTITASFSAVSYNITQGTITGGSVTIEPASANAGQTVTVTAVPAPGYSFTNTTTNWSSTPAVTFTPVTGYTATFTMPAENVTVTAAFNAVSYTVTAGTMTGGSVTIDSASATIGQTITVTAVPDFGYSFTNTAANWSSSSGVVFTPGAGNTATFTMPAENVTVTANFTLVSNILTFAVDPAGSGTVSPASGIPYEYNSPVYITGTPSAGYRFVNWTSNAGGTFSDAESASTTFNMPANAVTVTANFVQTTFNVFDQATWNAAVTGINALGAGDYTINVTDDFEMTGYTGNIFTGTDKKISITGAHEITLSGAGSLLRIASGQTVTLTDTALIGISGNSVALVSVSSGGVFEMYGTSSVSGNTSTATTAGVSVNGGSFTMNGSSTVSGNTASDTISSYGGGVYVFSGGDFTMNDSSSVSGNKISIYGGGVYVTGGSTFTMNGTSSVSDNTANDIEASRGGGVYVTGADSTFIMNGSSSVSDNTSRVGGGVFLSSSATFEMYGSSSVSGNSATYTYTYDYNGGGVYVNGGVFTMYGGTISGNTAAIDGGGVYVGSGSFTMNGGFIRGNESSGGGGVYVSGGTFTMNEGIIGGSTVGDRNTASSNGGGVYVDGGTFLMYDGSFVSNNRATSYGGGVYIASGTFNMGGGSVLGNTATTYSGGGVYVSGGTFTMSGGGISGNTASNYGGGVYVNSGDFRMINGTIYGTDEPSLQNTSANGAALYVYSGGTAAYGPAPGTANDFRDVAGVASGSYGLSLTIEVVSGVLIRPVTTVTLASPVTSAGLQTAINSLASGSTIILPDGNHYFASPTITVNKDITITAAPGNTVNITVEQNIGYSTFTVNSGGQLTLGGGGGQIIIDGENNATLGRRCVSVMGGILVMNDGVTIQNYVAQGQPPGVYVQTGTFIMNGGLITGNSGSHGGGVAVGVYNNSSITGTFTMNGGTITNNQAVTYPQSGGVYISEGSTFNGTIGDDYMANGASGALWKDHIFGNTSGDVEVVQ